MMAAAAFLLALAIVFVCWRSRHNYCRLPALQLTTQTLPQSAVTVIIPARNEEDQICRAVTSLRSAARVIVVDDDSADATVSVAEQAGAEVIAAPPLVGGALGKPTACAAGAAVTTGEWLLFVDADTWFEPEFVPSLLAYASARQLDFVTAFLRQHCETLAERILLPYSFALYFTGVNSGALADPRSKDALANGQCLLVRRDAYMRIGGHLRVLNSIIEDVALAHVAKQHGLRIAVLRAEQLGHVRMYRGLAAIWRGFEKNSFRFLLANPRTGWQVVASSILLTSWLPVLSLTMHTVLTTTGPVPSFGVAAAMMLFLAPLAGLLPWYRESGPDKSWHALFALIAIYLFQLVALNGMLTVLLGRKTVWKERRV